MKYLLIGFFTRTYMPYIEKYERILKKENVPYDIVFWDRDSTQTSIVCEHNEYTFCHITTTSTLKKIVPLFKYIYFVKQLIKTNKYDKLIVFTTIPSIFLISLLLNEYDGKYIYDYRDVTYERWLIFRKLVNTIVDHSYFTAISSKGYLNILSFNKKILLCHNISNMEYIIPTPDNIRDKAVLTIGFLGYVRYFDVNSNLIQSFKGYSNFQLKYYGTNFSNCNLKQYAESIQANNVLFYGKYNNDDKPRLYQEIDLINSIYSTDSPEVKYAIPNRLYDAVLFKKPIIASKGTYLAEIVENYGLGLVVDPYDRDIPVRVKEYIHQYNYKKFEIACNNFLDIVEKDEEKINQMLENFIKEI